MPPSTARLPPPSLRERMILDEKHHLQNWRQSLIGALQFCKAKTPQIVSTQ
jgi:hypothetical protein